MLKAGDRIKVTDHGKPWDGAEGSFAYCDPNYIGTVIVALDEFPQNWFMASQVKFVEHKPQGSALTAS